MFCFLFLHFFIFFSESWKVKECDDIIGFLELWQPLLPEWVIDNINEQLILPRLQKGVDSWNPTQDRMPIHAWLHPWLPFMGKEREREGGGGGIREIEIHLFTLVLYFR